MAGLQPDTSVTELLQQVYQTTIAQNRSAEKPGKYQATVIEGVSQPNHKKGYIPAYDPFWSASDDQTRFDNMGVISDKVTGKKVAIVAASPVFDRVFDSKDITFDYSTLLRVPYTTAGVGVDQALVGKEVIEMVFANRTTLEKPTFIKKASPKILPVPNVKVSKTAKTIIPIADEKYPCGSKGSDGSPTLSGKKCKCHEGFKWDEERRQCICPELSKVIREGSVVHCKKLG